MTSEFCEELVSTCDGQITFPTYDGESFCDKHTGGGDDYYWSYPYTECEYSEEWIQCHGGDCPRPRQGWEDHRSVGRLGYALYSISKRRGAREEHTVQHAEVSCCAH